MYRRAYLICKQLFTQKTVHTKRTIDQRKDTVQKGPSKNKNKNKNQYSSLNSNCCVFVTLLNRLLLEANETGTNHQLVATSSVFNLCPACVSDVARDTSQVLGTGFPTWETIINNHHHHTHFCIAVEKVSVRLSFFPVHITTGVGEWGGGGGGWRGVGRGAERKDDGSKSVSPK